jgi:hypothetical protein
MYEYLNHLFDITLKNITPWFVWFLFISHVFLIGSFLLLGTYNKSYVTIFSKIVRYFVCVFLLLRFHPFRKHTLGKYDGQIIFISAMFLLTNEGMMEFLVSHLDKKMNEKIIS